MTTIFCRKCHAVVEEGEPFCARCLTLVQRTSLLRRIFGRFTHWCGDMFSRSGPHHAHLSDHAPVTRTDITHRTDERITFTDRNTGEVRVYNSRDELPPALRETIDSALDASRSGSTSEFRATMNQRSITKRIVTGSDGREHREIFVRDGDGEERSYRNLDELPPEFRRLLRDLPEPNGPDDQRR